MMFKPTPLGATFPDAAALEHARKQHFSENCTYPHHYPEIKGSKNQRRACALKMRQWDNENSVSDVRVSAQAVQETPEIETEEVVNAEERYKKLIFDLKNEKARLDMEITKLDGRKMWLEAELAYCQGRLPSSYWKRFLGLFSTS